MAELLVIKPSSFGDIIHGLQVAETLRSQRPEYRITWVVSEVFAPLVSHCRTVDEVLLFRRHRGVVDFWRLLSAIRASRYDAVLDFQGLARSGLMTWAARAERKLGRPDAREGARLAYSELIAQTSTGAAAHALEILLQFLPLFDLEPILRGQLTFRRTDLPQGLSGCVERPPILIFPGSRRSEKIWPGFTDFTSRLLASGNERVFWVGIPAIGSATLSGHERFLNLTGRTSLPEVIALISISRMVVGNDSGPIHLASALKIPLLALFGPTDPGRYGPYPLDCSDNHVLRAPEGVLGRLSVATVLEKAVACLGALNSSL